MRTRFAMKTRRFGVLVALALFTCIVQLLFYISHPDVSGKRLVVYSQRDTPFSHDACYKGKDFVLGFGSCKQGTFTEFMGVVAAIAYSRKNGGRGVRVALDGAWWDDYFEQPYSEPAPEVHFNTIYQMVGRYRSFNNYYFDGSFPCPTARPEISDARRLVREHVRLLPKVEKRLQEYVDHNFKGRHVIGIHYRGTDKIVVSGQRPLQRYLDTALALKRSNSFLYIATDTSGVIETFEAAFPGRILSIDMRRASNTSKMGIHRSGIGHVDDAMMDVLRLSRCDLIIKGRSSLSDTAILMSNRPFIFI